MLAWGCSEEHRSFIMNNIYTLDLDDPHLEIKKFIILLMLAGLLASTLGFSVLGISKVIAKSNQDSGISEFSAIQGNSLLSISNPQSPQKVIKKVRMIATGYSSTVAQTDSTPFITASGSTVRDGIVANNMLPFGTEIRIPELYGDKIFVVEDRMNRRKGKYHVDIWFSEYRDAKEFGAKIIYLEVLSG